MDSLQAPRPKAPFLRRLHARLAASRFLTFSLLIHVVLVLAAGSVVLFRRDLPPPDFTIGDQRTFVAPDPTGPEPSKPNEQATEIFTPPTPSVPAPELAGIALNAVSPKGFTLPATLPAVVADPNPSRVEPAPVNPAATGLGHVPDAMLARFGVKARTDQIVKNKGKKKSEEAVMAALRWLKAHQNEDGSWGEEFKPAMTGLAMLTFFGHGELQISPEFGPTVNRGVNWLIERGNEFDGRYSLTKDDWGGSSGVYQHAICTYALGEYYSITQDDRAKDVLSKAVKLIVDGQNNNGGWMYSYAKGGVSDTSVTGWQVQALKAAHLTGLQLPGVGEALDKCMQYFKDAQAPDGTFIYQQKGDQRYSLAGIGTLCVYFWKQDKDKLVHDGIRYIVDKSKKDNPVDYQSGSGDLYAWYYDTQACLMYGGDAWTRWNGWFQDQIADNQSKDGSWPPLAANKSPGGELQKKPEGDGPYYRTTLCALMLEVYYRNLPINRQP